MDNIYKDFSFVKSLSLNSTRNSMMSILDKKTEEIPFIHAVVEFRPIYKTYDGSFGFDWYRKEDNGHLNGQKYQSCINGGYKDGRSNLSIEEAINRFLDMYEEIAINLPSYKNKKNREDKNYHVPYVSMFSEKTVTEMNLPKDMVKPKFTIELSALVETARNVTLRFEYDNNYFEVNPQVLADKSGGKTLQPSKTGKISITCKKDLDSNKEIKIYAYPQDKKFGKSLAGKLIILQNDEKVRKNLNVALVNVKTKIRNEEYTGKIEMEEIEALRKALYQCLIVPEIFYDDNPLDLTSDNSFKILIDNAGAKEYGKYILRGTSNTSEWLDGGIFHSSNYTDCQDYIKNKYIEKNKMLLRAKFFQGKGYVFVNNEKHLSENIFTIFSFREYSYNSNTTSPNPLKRHTVEGEVKAINEKTAMLFNGLNGDRSDETTLAHEVMHGLGLYHTHMNDNPIGEPRILCTFDKNTTDNIMAYKDIVNNKEGKRQTLWRWQWKIANPHIPAMDKDPK